MTPRGLLITIFATALGFALVIAGVSAIADTRDQEVRPPSSEAAAQTVTGPAFDLTAERAQAYDDFIAGLVRQLGDDKTAVDAAIHTVLNQQVDQRRADGDLEAEHAAALHVVIEVSESPLFLGLGGPSGFDGLGRFEDHGRFVGRSADHSDLRGESNGSGGTWDGAGASPASLPITDGASIQSAPDSNPAVSPVIF